jgi:hypothetical protein
MKLNLKNVFSNLIDSLDEAEDVVIEDSAKI